MNDRTKKLLAVYLSTIMVFSVFASATVVGPAAAVTTNVGTVTVGDSPSVNVADATIDASSDSNVTVGVNVSETGDARGDIELKVLNDSAPPSQQLLNTQSLDDANISGLSGTGNVTIPANTVGNDFTLRVRAINSTSNALRASGTSSITVSGGSNTYINGTVTNASGSAISGVTVYAVSTQNGQPSGIPKSTTTDENGNFSHSVSAGTYWVFADGHPTHEPKLKSGNSVTAGSTTTVDFQLPEYPDRGYINGTYLDADGNPVSDAVIDARDASYRFENSTTPDANGRFNISVRAANYTVTASPNSTAVGVAGATLEGVRVQEGQTTDVTIQPAASGYITGTVTNASGAAKTQNVRVVATSGNRRLFNKTNSNGEYNITAPAGEYTVSVFAQDGSATAKTVTVNENSETQADFTLKNISVLHSSVEVVSGSGSVDTGNVGVEAGFDSEGLLRATVVNESQHSGGLTPPGDLESLGANESTEFRINITVQNYSTNALLWGINNSQWSTSENDSVTNGTDITVRGTPVNLQASLGPGIGPNTYGAVFSDNPSWSSGWSDRAQAGRNQTIFFSVSSLSNLAEAERNRLDGISVTTNAQKFTIPKVVNQTLSVWVAGPSLTQYGEDHTGFYEAKIPQAQLDDWNVSDPESELSVSYKGQQVNSTITNTNSGATVLIENISYSAGFSDVEANPSSDGPSSPSPSGGGGISGGGGGGAGQASQVTTQQTDTGTEATIEQVTLADPTVTISTAGTSSGGVSVTEVSATFTKATNSQSTMSVSASTSPPSGTPDPPSTDNVLSYVDVTVEGSLAKSISEGRFTVDVSERNVDPAAVTAQRYDGSEWHDVETEPVGDSTVEVISPDGYSVFSISASESNEPEQPTTTPTDSTTETPTDETAATDTPQAETDSEGAPTETATSGPDTPAPTATPTATPGAGGPGFGVLIAVLAVVAALVARRHRRP